MKFSQAGPDWAILIRYFSRLDRSSFFVGFSGRLPLVRKFNYENSNIRFFASSVFHHEIMLIRPLLMKNFKIFLKNDWHSIDAARSQDHVDISHEA